MEPISVIVTAIVLGATAGLKPTAEAAVRDAYAGLKALVLHRFSKHAGTAKAVADVEGKPDSPGRKAVLEEELAAAGAGNDQEVVDRAAEVLKLLESRSPGITGGLVGQINAAGGKVTVIGTSYGPITM